MNQCVPRWNFHENSFPPDVPSLDYEVAELTWENGQLAMHGLGPPRVANKPTASASPTKDVTWDKPRAGGTLESIVNQATRHPQPKSAVDSGVNNANEVVNPAATMTMDALVPCNNNNIRRNENQENSSHVLDFVCSTRVGSCSGAAVPRVGIGSCKTNGSVSKSATCGERESRQVTLDTSYEREFGGTGFTTTSLVSPENTVSGGEYTKTSGDDYDSVSHGRSQACQRPDQTGDEEGKQGTGKSSSVSTKRRRAAAIHNQSERKRRDRINQRMKTLQKLVPNSSKTDKASVLDEVIEYLKQLQTQVHMMSRMNMTSPMMLQHLQMSMMAGMGMGMGMGVMDMNNISRPAAGMPPVIPPATAFKTAASWDNLGDGLPTPPGPVVPDPALLAFLACQSQPTTMDAYSMLQAAFYQQFKQAPGSDSNN